MSCSAGQCVDKSIQRAGALLFAPFSATAAAAAGGGVKTTGDVL